MKRVVAALALFLALYGAAKAEEIAIGRWCDRPVPGMPSLDRILTIRIDEEGTAEAYSQFQDGSESTRKLEEMSANTFRVKESATGDTYRIVESSGDLQLLDKDGFIRSAKRLENMPQPGDCQR